MEVTTDLKRAICSLFEVHADEGGMQRIVTPLQYTGSGDHVVVRVRPKPGGWQIDDSGDTALNASLSGGDIESELVTRWTSELTGDPVEFDADEELCAFADDERLIVPYVFRVAEAAQRLHALATAKAERKQSDFKRQVAAIVSGIVEALGVSVYADHPLPIVGDMRADYYFPTNGAPLVLIAANTPTRLLEAEVIHMQYQHERKPANVVAIAESQAAVGRQQFERAAYFTSRTVAFSPTGLQHLLNQELAPH